MKRTACLLALAAVVPATALGWSSFGTHGSQTQLALQWIEDHDPTGRYAWLYARRWWTDADAPGFYNPRVLGEDVVPGETDHPAVIGAYSEGIWGPEGPPWFRSNSTDALNFVLDKVAFGHFRFDREPNHYGTGTGLAWRGWFGHAAGLTGPDDTFAWQPGCPRSEGHYAAADVWGHGDDACANTLGFAGAVDVFRHGTRQAWAEAMRRIGHVAHLMQDLGQPDHAAGLPNFVCSDLGDGNFWADVLLKALMWMVEKESGVSIDDPPEQWVNNVGFNGFVRLFWPDIESRLDLDRRAPLRGDDYFDFMDDAAADALAIAGARTEPLGCRGFDGKAIDPDGDNTAWRDLAVDLNRRVVMRTAGLLQYFYELVNPPPHVAEVRLEQTAAAFGGRYRARWDDVLEPAPALAWGRARYSTSGFPTFAISHTVEQIVPDVLVRRELSEEADAPLVTGLDAQLQVRFAPNTIAPKRMRFAQARLLGAGGAMTRAAVTADGEWWSIRFPVPCSVKETAVWLSIQAGDGEAHLDERLVADRPLGDQLDADPSTIAYVSSADVAVGADRWIGYEPGAAWFRVPIRNLKYGGLSVVGRVFSAAGRRPGATEAVVWRAWVGTAPVDESWEVSANVITDLGVVSAAVTHCMALSWSIDPVAIGPDGNPVVLADAGLDVRGAFTGHRGTVTARPSPDTPLGVYRVRVTVRGTGGLVHVLELPILVTEPPPGFDGLPPPEMIDPDLIDDIDLGPIDPDLIGGEPLPGWGGRGGCTPGPVILCP